MESNLEKRIKNYAVRHKRRKIWYRILSALSAAVVFCTTYALILPAITQEREAFCEKAEHAHSEECFELIAEAKSVLQTCEDAGHIHEIGCFAPANGYENAEILQICEISAEAGHSHGEECYIKNQICTEEENHLHSEECYSGDALSCEKAEGHIHSEECFEAALSCEIPESEGHSHGAGCYAVNVFSCAEEEHQHTAACYSDETADIETEEIWKNAFANMEIGDVISENVIAIAKSQLGYHESTKNYIVLEDGETAKGRTRYGEWYGEPYMDWNTLFAGFCLHFSGADIPFYADIERWTEALSAPEANIYKTAGEHEPLPGDIVFISLENSGKADAAGFVYAVSETGIEIILGDYGDSVQTVTYGINDEKIIGYGVIAVPSPYKCGKEEHIHEERCFDEDGNIVCGFDEHGHSDACLAGYEEPEEPEYFCGLDEHAHAEGCYDESENLVCEAEEHAHSEECLSESGEPEYFCGFDEHAHAEGCYDEGENLVCEAEEHAHSEECLSESGEPEYFCGFDEHAHAEGCYDEGGNLVCEAEEHAHSEECLSESGEPEYFCGFDEHAHAEDCYDEGENLVCEAEEHTHTDGCLINFESLPEEEKIRIEKVVSMIDALPTADEIDTKIMEFEEAEDYEGEEAWLTEVYRNVQLAYKYYKNLPEDHRRFVPNSEKLMELEFIWSAAVLVETEIAKTVSYSSDMFTSSALFVVYTEGEDGYYAFDGNGSAVPINIDSNGIITADVADKNELLWSFTAEGTNTYIIQNMSSGRYMHAYPNNGSGVTTAGAYSSVIIETAGGVRIRSNTEYAYLDEGNGVFRMTQTASRAAVYSFGIYDTSNDVYVWFDGTNGGMGMYSGSPDMSWEEMNGKLNKGDTITLPQEWESPTRYAYSLRGWYDVISGNYYPPGSEITVEKSMVLYADWIPASYDIGQFNAQTSNTVSSNEFVTVKVFDYGPFFNIPSAEVNVTVNASGHSENWSMAEGESEHRGFVFRDWDSGKLSYPGGADSGVNRYTGGATNSGILDAELIELLFGTGNSFNPATGTGVMGKEYLGTGDHLFQYCDDPANTEYYGYYYYDSLYHAASYNRSAQRFYVYDYLERATTSSNADFLPLNSPYVNTNGQTVGTYTYGGVYGEYGGTTHYQYDGTSGRVNPEYWFGVQTDIEFYLPSSPGGTDSEGNNVNQGVNGEDLVFDFTGDDDVWVYVDGRLVLDIGGIHDALKGSINFSTGEVIVNGQEQDDVTYLAPGQHTLTMYYLERGGGSSNWKLKFNIGTRYGLKLQKEDVLTRELLNGAEFTVYTDQACTQEAQLWKSHAGYEAGEPTQSTFVVANGYTEMWGLSAGSTYYIKETKYPENGYGAANGIIVMKLNSKGIATFDVIPDPDADGNNLSGGFTVHGYKIDVENHEVYLVATNGKYGDEVTSVTAIKKWNDTENHSGTPVTVYLLADRARIQEVTLGEENNWEHTWDNLPLYNADGTEVVYTVEEGTVPGYFGTITEIDSSEIETTAWTEASSFTSGETYILKTNSGYLAANSSGFYWETDENAAKASEESRWIVTKSGNTHTFRNEAGYTIYYYNGGSSNRYFSASKSPSGTTGLTYTNGRIRSGSNNYMGSLNNGRAGRTSSSYSALTFTPYMETVTTDNIEIDGIGFLITNTPIEEAETVLLKVSKEWNTGNLATAETYEQLSVTVKLIASGRDSGMSAVLNLKNGWTYSFTDLPKFDSGGKEIKYTVEEILPNKDWTAEYGEIVQTDENTFETTVTNIYNLHYELPKTGGGGNIISIIGGILLLTAGSALIYKQNHKRRGKEDDTS